MSEEKKRFHPSFYFTVNSLFLFLVLSVGGILSWHNFQATKKIVLAQAQQSYDQASREVSADFVHTYRAVFQNISLLSFSRVTSSATLEERLQSLDMFSTALRNAPQIKALQAGYSNGDYFIVRSLRTDRVKELFQAPDQAAFNVDHVATDPADGKRYLVRLFFDTGLREISRNSPEITDYDPRLRPWYQQAASTTQIRATLPYLFYFFGEIGTTVSYNPPGTSVVVGADVALSQLSDTLAENVLTPNSEIVLFHPQGLVWAYKDFKRVVVQEDDNRFDTAELSEIRYWEQVAAGGDKEALRSSLKKQWQGLDADFSFVAECNLGGEFMAPEKIERLEKIARRTWQRTLDDRIGISWEEAARKARVPKPSLPAEEFLLADRPDHRIERTENERMPDDNPWGFKLDVPEYRYNRGELYNLRVARGTLSAEERFKINDHIVQTITMLEKLPYPKHLRQTPELAGGHHETMDGKGYPRQLTGDKMSLTARMMAIADIFEALTASDRPYKKAKKLSNSIHIMHMMKQDHHIDPDLFDLFLRSGVYLRYAEQYLDPEQIDEVDIESYLA
jgi:hypothetical protein